MTFMNNNTEKETPGAVQNGKVPEEKHQEVKKSKR